MPTLRTVRRSASLRDVIVGVDEAGRGPLAGPVFAGACVLPHRRILVRIADSKLMTLKERERAFAWIQKHCAFGFGFVAAQEIDRIGILVATELAMQQAIAMLARTVTPTFLLVDGRDRFWFAHPHRSIVRGDQSEKCIGAASIVAKVLRDRWMVDHAKVHPQYRFEANKGYGTAEHIALIRKHGPCVLHRRSFLKNV